MPTLRAVALFREYFVRTLLAPARLSAGAERALGPGAGGRRLAGARRFRPALSLLRPRRFLPRLPPQSHRPGPLAGAEPPALAQAGDRQAPPVLHAAALEPAHRDP